MTKSLLLCLGHLGRRRHSSKREEVKEVAALINESEDTAFWPVLDSFRDDCCYSKVHPKGQEGKRRCLKT